MAVSLQPRPVPWFEPIQRRALFVQGECLDHVEGLGVLAELAARSRAPDSARVTHDRPASLRVAAASGLRADSWPPRRRPQNASQRSQNGPQSVERASGPQHRLEGQKRPQRRSSRRSGLSSGSPGSQLSGGGGTRPRPCRLPTVTPAEACRSLLPALGTAHSALTRPTKQAVVWRRCRESNPDLRLMRPATYRWPTALMPT